jgi:carbon storage regulator
VIAEPDRIDPALFQIRDFALAQELLDQTGKPSTVEVVELMQIARPPQVRRLKHHKRIASAGPPRKVSMLVLSRKKDESIVINNDITIVVVEIRGDKVRLGVEAPKEVPVHRQEVFEAIARGETVAPVDADAGKIHGGVQSGEDSSPPSAG